MNMQIEKMKMQNIGAAAVQIESDGSQVGVSIGVVSAVSIAGVAVGTMCFVVMKKRKMEKKGLYLDLMDDE